jgi:hypothetical protein
MFFRALLLLLCCACASAQTGLPAPPRGGLPGADPRECGDSRYSALCPAGRWAQFSGMTLKVVGPRFAADYTIEQAANGEMHATYRERVAGRDRGGEIILVGAEGFAYRSREAFPDPGSILDYMASNPLMMSSLVALLLDLGVLGPPSEVSAAQSIKAASATQYLRTPAPRTAILYGAPWSMSGTVRRAGDDEVAFALRLRYAPVDRNGNAVKGKSETLTLDGKVSYAPRREAFPDSFDLVGWKLMKMDAPQRKVDTLGEAREVIGP